jgi:undecaprenyl diphosphate synthase
MTLHALQHVLIVGGTTLEWSAMSDAEWAERAELLGGHCDRAGVPWVTIRAYGPGGADPTASPPARHYDVGGCSVTIDPNADGRQRFAEAMRRLDPTAEITEKTVAEALYAPADCEPDLVLVLGPATQLPPSLMWELAYAELVFVDVTWSALAEADIAAATADFAGRRRRFGGLDGD